ncbi:MAG: radical SAM protein [Candidatus Omnitrophica bacterium]|nr:radical SAM protein [Candidatus Omnitrophota bacterium]
MMEIKKPIFCDIGITERCMFRCRMCRFWETAENRPELSGRQWIEFIGSLKESWGNDIRLHFAGGEPLLKDGFLDILDFANDAGFRTFIVTNGFLMDENIAGRLTRSGTEGITISLDSLDAQTHDFLRGTRGAHRQAITAIGHLREKGAKGITVLAVIMGYNLGHIIELADWAQANEHISSIYFQAISQPIATAKDSRWYEKEEFSCLWPGDLARLDSVIERLADYKRRGYKISNSISQLEMFKTYFRQPERLFEGMVCTQGDYVIYIRPGGDVLLCGSMAPIGNVRENSIKDLWDSPEASLRREQIHNCQEACLNVINCFVDKDLP